MIISRIFFCVINQQLKGDNKKENNNDSNLNIKDDFFYTSVAKAWLFDGGGFPFLPYCPMNEPSSFMPVSVNERYKKKDSK